jgi:hypothetical protein
MVQLRIFRLFPSIALIALAAGCAHQNTDTVSTLSDPAAAVTSTQVDGTWRGSFAQVRRWSSSSLDGDVMLEIKDDGSYKLATGRANDSGVAIADGSGVTLRSSQGQTSRLTRQGDMLHGMVQSSGGVMHVSVQRMR